MIESIPGHPDDELFTFLWHGEPDQVALNVVFNGWLPLHKTPGFDSFTRLGNSDVWYTSYELPRIAHIRYELITPKGWQLKRVAEAPRRPIRFYPDAGTWEGKVTLFSNRMLRSILAGKGYDVVYNESDGTHSAYFWMLRLPDGLQATLGHSGGAPQGDSVAGHRCGRDTLAK